MTAQTKKDNPLLRTLKSAGNALWFTVKGLLSPVGLTFKKNTKGKRRLALSLKWPRAAFFTGVYMVLQPLSLFLFPSARSALDKNGFDPETAKNLTEVPANKIRIVSNNVAGKAYVLFSAPPLFQPFTFTRNIITITDESLRGFQTTKKGYLANLISPKTNLIFLKDNKAFQDENNNAWKRTIEAASSGFFTQSPLMTGEEYAHKVLLHEIRHTSKDNHFDEGLYREADSDHAAIVEMMRRSGDTTLARRFVHEKAISIGGSPIHDNVIYLHHKFNNIAIPSQKAIFQANTDAYEPMTTAMNLYFHNLAMRDDAKTDSLKFAFNRQCAHLSPLAKLRVSLCVDALKAQTVANPSLLEHILKPKS